MTATERVGAPAGRTAGSIRVRLLVLIAAIVAPAALAFSLLIFDLYRHERTAKEQQLFETARAMSTAADAKLGQGWVLLETLAKSEALQRGDLAAFDAEARRAGQPGMSILLSAPDGAQLVSTRHAPGETLATARGTGDAARWQRLLRERRIVSDLFYGRTTRRATVALDMLVDRDGRPAYALSLLIEPSEMARLLASQRLPDGWIAGLLDRQAVLIARAPSIPGYVGIHGVPPVSDLVLSGREGVTNATTIRRLPVVVAYARSPTSHWTTTVAAPRSQFQEGLFRSLGLALAIAAFFLLAGAVLAFGLAQRIVRAVRLLARQANAVGELRSAPAVATGLADTDEVSLVLAQAAADRDAHERSLSELNASLEARVAEATDQLVQARKMEALGQLTGGVAHDFNNLLTAVMGNLSLLQASDLTDRQRRWAGGAMEASERGAKLTGQLLAFARRQRLEPETIDVGALLAAMESLLASTLGSSVRVRITPSEGPVFATADRTQLELAVVNLAINARDAMPDGGVLTLSARTETVGPTRRADGAPEPGAYAVIAVQDNGEGMSAEVQRRALEPFFTTKGPGRGSGLGLSQALGMATQQGGGLTIESARGAGTTIRVYLPLAAPPSAPQPAAALPAHDAVGLGPLTILLVDDDDGVRAATAGLLKSLGCTVIEAADGAGAVRVPLTGLDAVVADFAMPNMTGADLAEQLHAQRPDLPIVIITGFADPARLAALWRGIVLAKPFGAGALAEAIRGAIAAQAPS